MLLWHCHNKATVYFNPFIMTKNIPITGWILDNNAPIHHGISGGAWLVSSTNESEKKYVFYRFGLILSAGINSFGS